MTLTEQLISPVGKLEALKTLIGEKFCYLAIGTGPTDVEAGNGFEYDADSLDPTCGFNEVSVITDPSYYRIKLVQSDSSIDVDTGRATVTFVGELENDNIIRDISISQLAVVDNSDPNSPNTTYYALSTFPAFMKTEKTALSFELEFRM